MMKNKIIFVAFLLLLVVPIVYAEKYSDPNEVPTSAGGQIRLVQTTSAKKPLLAVFPSTVKAGEQFSGYFENQLTGIPKCKQGTLNDPSIHVEINGPSKFHDSIVQFIEQIKFREADKFAITDFSYTYPASAQTGTSSIQGKVFEEETGDTCYSVSDWDATTTEVQGTGFVDCTGMEKSYQYKCVGGNEIHERVGAKGECPTSWNKIKTCEKSCSEAWGNKLNELCLETASCFYGNYRCENGYVLKCAGGGGSLLVETCDNGCSDGTSDWTSNSDLCKKENAPIDDLPCPAVESWNLIEGECRAEKCGGGKYTTIEQCELAAGKKSESKEGQPCTQDEIFECPNKKEITTYQCKNGAFKKTEEICADTIKAGEECKAIIKNGDPKDKADFLFIGIGFDNYQELEQEAIKLIDFNGDSGYNGLFTLEPFKSNKDKFNFWMILASDYKEKLGEEIRACFSTASGLRTAKEVIPYEKKCPFQSDETIALFKNAKFNAFAFTDTHIMALSLPCDKNQIWCIENCEDDDSTKHKMIFKENSKDFGRTFLHETGHAFANLGDEYTSQGSTRDEAPEKNCVKTLEDAKKKWGDLIGVRDVGFYTGNQKLKMEKKVTFTLNEGCGYIPENIRPTNNSMMAHAQIYWGADFGPVNERYIKQELGKFKTKKTLEVVPEEKQLKAYTFILTYKPPQDLTFSSLSVINTEGITPTSREGSYLLELVSFDGTILHKTQFSLSTGIQSALSVEWIDGKPTTIFSEDRETETTSKLFYIPFFRDAKEIIIYDTQEPLLLPDMESTPNMVLRIDLSEFATCNFDNICGDRESSNTCPEDCGGKAITPSIPIKEKVSNFFERIVNFFKNLFGIK